MGTAVRPDDSAEGEIDLDPELRAQVRELARRLPSLTYYELLGLERGADGAAVRDAFFQQSKRFHPDRFFRRNLGPYRELITEVYKRMVAAHDVLRDPEQRASYDQSLGPEPAGRADEPPAPPPPSLRARTGLRSRDRVLERLRAQIDQAQAKAERRFQDAEAQKRRGNWAEAAALLRMAMALAPREARYRRAFEELAPEANAQQARALRARAELLLGQGRAAEAIELFFECCEREPTDAVLADRVARLIAEQRGDLARGIELARRALALDGSSLEFRRTLARLLKARGDSKGARREYQRIWQQDPTDAEAKRELA